MRVVTGLHVSGLPGVASESNDAEKENFLMQASVDLPVTD